MLRLLKTCCALALLTAGVQSAKGFALVGPKEGFQTSILGYTKLSEIVTPGSVWSLLSNPEWQFAPHNLGEEYRWSVPTLYYTYDPSFLEYFGSNGVRAVDQAVGILNALTNVDTYSRDLSEFPLDELRFNHTASALHLFDLKSAALEMLVTELGLADSERWTWCMRNRQPIPGAPCPIFDYSVIQRNFDPVTDAYSKYVNGNLFTYQILEICPPAFDRQDPVEVLVDPSDVYQTAVSASKITYPNILYYGAFHTGLTRDDVGGLRYLYSITNRNVEISPGDTLLFDTNRVPQLLFPSNLSLLAAQSLTNNPAQLAALYPGLVITASSNTFGIARVTNVFAAFTNNPWDPAGTFPHLLFTTNVTLVPQIFFQYTFGNLLILQPTNGTFVGVPSATISQFTGSSLQTIQTTTVSFQTPPFSTVPVLVSNVTSRTILNHGIVGEFFILPTNACDVSILGVLLTNTVFITNVVASTSNTFTTNILSGTQSFEQDVIDRFTSHVLVVDVVFCNPSTTGLRGGLQKISFVRHDFDSLLNRFFYPVTNEFSMVAVTNNQSFIQKFRRVITRPDIVFAATDIGPNDVPIEVVDRDRDAPNFNGVTNAFTAGPGTIEGPITFTFNKVGPIRLNTGAFLVDEAVSVFYFQWGSFDGSTNAPYIYSGDTANDIQNQLLIQISPSSIPDGTAGDEYSAALSVSGGQAPYAWTLGPGSSPLPPGLTLTQNPVDSSQATISGTPAIRGNYQFWIRVTDAGSRFIDQVYVLSIN